MRPSDQDRCSEAERCLHIWTLSEHHVDGLQVWDLATAQCQHTLTHHKRKVQAVAWNPAEAPMLLSGGFDKVTAMVCISHLYCPCKP